MKGSAVKGYLYRQNDPAVAAARYGRLRLPVSYVGCGLVAIYNVMRRLGQPQEFAAIVRDAQRLHMPWLFGLFGTKPHAPAKYFRAKQVPFVQTDSAEKFRAALRNCNAAILCTWNDKRTQGIHFFTVFNDNGRLTALNRYDGGTRPTPFTPQDVKDKRFITGLIFNA